MREREGGGGNKVVTIASQKDGGGTTTTMPCRATHVSPPTTHHTQKSNPPIPLIQAQTHTNTNTPKQTKPNKTKRKTEQRLPLRGLPPLLRPGARPCARESRRGGGAAARPQSLYLAAHGPPRLRALGGRKSELKLCVMCVCCVFICGAPVGCVLFSSVGVSHRLSCRRLPT